VTVTLWCRGAEAEDEESRLEITTDENDTLLLAPSLAEFTIAGPEIYLVPGSSALPSVDLLPLEAVRLHVHIDPIVASMLHKARPTIRLFLTTAEGVKFLEVITAPLFDIFAPELEELYFLDGTNERIEHIIPNLRKRRTLTMEVKVMKPKEAGKRMEGMK
jgi:hypothetical protein